MSVCWKLNLNLNKNDWDLNIILLLFELHGKSIKQNRIYLHMTLRGRMFETSSPSKL